MDLKQLVPFVFQASIAALVFQYGLQAKPTDVTFLFRKPLLLTRSLAEMFLLMPAIAVMLAVLLDLDPAVKVALITLSLSPVPAVLPGKQLRAGGHASYAIGLMVAVSALSIVITPTLVELVGRILGRSFSVPSGAVAKTVLITVLLPLAAGMMVSLALPGAAGRIAAPIKRVAMVLLTAAVLLLLVGALPAVGKVIRFDTLIAMIAFVVLGLVLGHLLGGPDRDNSIVLALSNVSRHPAIAIAVASTLFPGVRFGAIILLYVLISTLLALPYITLLRRHAMTDASRAAPS